MGIFFNHPWPFGLAFLVVLVLALESGRRVAAYTRLHEDQNRKETNGHVRDGLFVLVSLLCAITAVYFNSLNEMIIAQRP